MDWIAKWWITAIFGLILAGLTGAFGYVMRRTKATDNGLQALLRDRIIQAYNHYMYERGSCPIYALQNIRSMYDAYHALGGNGAVDKLMEDIEDLPTEIRKEDEK
jgi:hypothetical protein